MMPLVFIDIFIFLFGSVVGSFLNVCIYRLPKELSIVTPRSFCPQCNNLIRWFDNIPFLSYVLLRGRCRSCGGRISFRYFVVEGLTALSFLVFFKWFGFSFEWAIFTTLSSALIVMSFIDLEYQLIPDVITLPGVVSGLMVSFLYPALHGMHSPAQGLLRALLGAIVGGGAIYLTGLLGNFIFKKESMGGGDVKLLAMVGAFVGWKMVLLIYFLAPFFGAAVGLVMKFKYHKDIIPYGPFLSLATFVAILWGKPILFRFLMTSGF